MLKSIHSELERLLKTCHRLLRRLWTFHYTRHVVYVLTTHPKAKSTVPNHDENANKSIVTRTSDSDFPLSQRNEQSNKEDDGILA